MAQRPCRYESRPKAMSGASAPARKSALAFASARIVADAGTRLAFGLASAVFDAGAPPVLAPASPPGSAPPVGAIGPPPHSQSAVTGCSPRRRRVSLIG